MRWVLALGAMAVSGCEFARFPGDDPDAAGASPDAIELACDPPFTAGVTGCHAFPADTSLPPMTWSQARTACQDLGGDLPIIDSAAEATEVTSMQAASDGRRIWLGLSGTGTDGAAWTWVDGETVAQKALSLWMPGQPKAGTTCAVVRPDNHQWAGRRCNEKMLVVCEKS